MKTPFLESLWAVATRPTLWRDAAGALLATAPRAWWRRPPFLPLPDRRYLAWRLETAYGRSDAQIDAVEFLDYLRWRGAQRRS